jgi:hypothetical protein
MQFHVKVHRQTIVSVRTAKQRLSVSLSDGNSLIDASYYHLRPIRDQSDAAWIANQ